MFNYSQKKNKNTYFKMNCSAAQNDLILKDFAFVYMHYPKIVLFRSLLSLISSSRQNFCNAINRVIRYTRILVILTHAYNH